MLLVFAEHPSTCTGVCIAALIAGDRARRAAGAPPRTVCTEHGADLVQHAPTAYLVEARAELRTLLAEWGGGSDRLRVRSEGRIARRATPSPARGSLAGPDKGIVPLLAVPGASDDGEPLAGEAPSWLPGMPATRHIGAAVTSRRPPVRTDYALGASPAACGSAPPVRIRLRCCTGRDFAAQTEPGVRHELVRSHCPANGKVERFNRTLATEWDYQQVFTSSTNPPADAPHSARCA
ncbi:hypothetical protein ABZ914_01285 [Spirillospora sp. NPDC046719]